MTQAASVTTLFNILTCRWLYNGAEYYDIYATAFSDCGLVNSGYSLLGFDRSYINDNSAKKFPIVRSYLNSAACGR